MPRIKSAEALKLNNAFISSGKAEMKPKWHFILRTTLIISGICILILFVKIALL